MPISEVSDVAAWLLGRPLTEQDGVSPAELAEAEKRLSRTLPAALKEFYLAVGGQPVITSSFQRFAPLDQLGIDGDKIIFMEENQGVCWWATDANSRVYQATDLESHEWDEDNPGDLSAFLRVILYYQMAQGGYPHVGMIPSDEFSAAEDIQALINDMGVRPVVDLETLRIFVASDQMLIWYLRNQDGTMFEPGLFVSALHEEPFQRFCEQWQFDDLS